MSQYDKSLAQNTLISASTAETTIVTADPNCQNALATLIVTTVNAAAGTLTLRDGTGGVVMGIFDFPNAAAAPAYYLAIPFDPALPQAAKNRNWTLQASANATSYRVTAIYVKQS